MTGEEEPKIIIDEGWKSQVERERAEQQTAEEAGDGDDAAAPPEGEQDVSIFEHLISTLAAQTMMALGVIAAEGQDQVIVDLAYSKHLIDTLAMLREKTQGNLTEEEGEMLDQAVSELQQVFVARAQQGHDAAGDLSQNPADLSTPQE